jgi:hypothetical protein
MKPFEQFSRWWKSSVGFEETLFTPSDDKSCSLFSRFRNATNYAYDKVELLHF